MRTVCFTVLLVMHNILFSCAAEQSVTVTANSRGESPYSVYIINYSLHTGIVVPVNDQSIDIINALSYFKDYRFADIGWGEELYYQDPSDNFCTAARAVLLPNRSVLRLEGYANSEYFTMWSGYVVRIDLAESQYLKLLDYISKSFTKSADSTQIIASVKDSGGVIYFKSVHTYHLFNTCNTWVAEALETAGLDVAPFFTLTAGQLYDEIKDKGTVIKSRP